MIPFSVLDLVPIIEGARAADALASAARLARHVESLGFCRYWVAEHHNMPGIASAATAIVIGHVAGCTSRIRIGAGGIMLPNHAPLVIAEQFGTLASLYSDRIDLGLGRAPGTDPQTARALRRNMTDIDQFPQDIGELRGYFDADADAARQAIRAIPALDVHLPIWLLGSSLYSAELAARLGLPFAFAAHFSPDWLVPALELYREHFAASAANQRPHAMVCVNVVMADSDQAARRLFSSHQQAFIQLRRGHPGKLPPPVEDMDRHWSPEEKAMVEHTMRCSFVGSTASVEVQLTRFLRAVRPDELMVHVLVHDQAARLHSLTLTAQLRERLASTTPGAARAS
jgi:luciferase family oxidoreductase group 1